MTEKTKKTAFDMSTEDKMRSVALWLHQKMGKDILALDVEGICSISEGLVIVTATSTRHAQAMADYVLDEGAKLSFPYMGMEGYKSGGWLLVDFNDVLVHIFQDDSRGFYNLEGLWAEAKSVTLKLPQEAEDDFDISDF